jgi:hypothetical protein
MPYTENDTTQSGDDTTAVEGQEPDATVQVTDDTDGENDEGSQGDPTDGLTADDLRKEIAKLRKENAKTRTTAKEQAAKEARLAALAEGEQQLKAAIDARDKEWKDRAAKALGLVDAEPALTPEQVAERITQERDQARKDAEARGNELLELLREVAVQDAAAMHDASPGRLTDSRAFMAKVAAVDSADKAAFRVAVAELVEAEVEANPDLKAIKKTAPAAASGGTTTAGTAPRDLDHMSVDDLIDAGFTKRR